MDWKLYKKTSFGSGPGGSENERTECKKKHVE